MATLISKPLNAAPRTAVLTSTDVSFRQRLRETLTELRWQVREAAGGAEVLAHLDAAPAETVILDSWLPDLEIREFVDEFEKLYPLVDLVIVDDASAVKVELAALGEMRSYTPCVAFRMQMAPHGTPLRLSNETPPRLNVLPAQAIGRSRHFQLPRHLRGREVRPPAPGPTPLRLDCLNLLGSIR